MVIIGLFVVTSSIRRNRRSLAKTQISLAKGAEAVREIESENRRKTFRNFAVAFAFFGALILLFLISEGGK
jgi:hypothetical protein